VSKLSRRTLLIGAGVAAGSTATKLLSPSRQVLDGTTSLQANPRATSLNDASGLSDTPVFKHIIVTSDPTVNRIAILRQHLAEARRSGRAFSTSAARHSMGAHAIAHGGYHLALDNDLVKC
jgi:hypothetical protein